MIVDLPVPSAPYINIPSLCKNPAAVTFSLISLSINFDRIRSILSLSGKLWIFTDSDKLADVTTAA